MVADNTPTHIESDPTPQGLHASPDNLFSDDIAQEVEVFTIHVRDQEVAVIEEAETEAAVLHINALAKQARTSVADSSKRFLLKSREFEVAYRPIDEELEFPTSRRRFGIDFLDTDKRLGKFVAKHIFGERPDNRQRSIPSVPKMTPREIEKFGKVDPNRRR